MSDPAPNPATSVLARFAERRQHEFNELMRVVEAQGQQAAALRENMTRLAQSIHTAAAHRYSVFANASTKQLVVLRDVDALAGVKPLFQSASFASALAWVNANAPQSPLPDDEPLNPPLPEGPFGPLWPPPKNPTGIALPHWKAGSASGPVGGTGGSGGTGGTGGASDADHEP